MIVLGLSTIQQLVRHGKRVFAHTPVRFSMASATFDPSMYPPPIEGLKKYLPTTPSRAGRITIRRDGLHKGDPVPQLSAFLPKTGGRCRITGKKKSPRAGRVRRKYRIIDFKYNAEPNVTKQYVVRRIEYDPNRSARIALCEIYDAGAKLLSRNAIGKREDWATEETSPAQPIDFEQRKMQQAASTKTGTESGDLLTDAMQTEAHKALLQSIDAIDVKRKMFGSTTFDPYYYWIRNEPITFRDEDIASKRFIYLGAPYLSKAGDIFTIGDATELVSGNRMLLKNIQAGTHINNLEMRPGSGAKVVRSAGTTAQVLGKTANKRSGKPMVIVRLPSTELRYFDGDCYATVGRVGNTVHNQQKYGKAGASRWRGIRPTVRGVIKNAVDHPHGGHGKTVGRPKVDVKNRPIGSRLAGRPTRKSKRYSDHLIIKNRRKLRLEKHLS